MTRPGTRPDHRPDPGLDIDRLRALRRPAHDENNIRTRIETHLHHHDGMLAFSGGKDSLVTLHLALQVEPNLPVVFFDSGLEFPETLDYLDQVSELLNIAGGIRTYPARPGLLELLMETGSWDHTRPTTRGRNDVRRTVIDEPARRAHADHGPGLLWGVRSAESGGRLMLHRTALRNTVERGCSGCCTNRTQQRLRHGGLVARSDGTTAYSPVWNWTTDQIWDYLARHRLPLNPIYGRLRQLGAPEWSHRVTSIIDANQLTAGRAVWLRRGWPDIYARLLPALPRLAEVT